MSRVLTVDGTFLLISSHRLQLKACICSSILHHGSRPGNLRWLHSRQSLGETRPSLRVYQLICNIPSNEQFNRYSGCPFSFKMVANNRASAPSSLDWWLHFIVFCPAFYCAIVSVAARLYSTADTFSRCYNPYRHPHIILRICRVVVQVHFQSWHDAASTVLEKPSNVGDQDESAVLPFHDPLNPTMVPRGSYGIFKIIWWIGHIWVFLFICLGTSVSIAMFWQTCP